MGLKFDRVHNYNAGPAAVPLEVLERVNEQWFNYHGAGMNVMEMSHRSKEFDKIHNDTIAKVRQLLNIGEDYHVLFLQGGASTQFGMIPMNFLGEGDTADYINTGTWSTKAIKEAKLFGDVNVAFDGNDVDFMKLPSQDELKLTDGARYVHITSNNTIKGTQFRQFPDTNGVPLVCDMSSDIMSHPLDMKPFGMIYAGAQKNLGPSGVTLVVMRDDFAKGANEGLTTMLKYQTHIDKNSLFNTPPTFAIYLMGEVLQWVIDNGGLEGMAARNQKKADMLYGFFNDHPDYFKCPVAEDSRSWMNVCFRLPNEDLEGKMIAEATRNGFIGMKGHRSVGGLRISMYNAAPPESIEAVIAFMKDFMTHNG
ncbi:3-phosphoserine/phosphohydroxythreonine transaminase [bacterium]|nr:3-phosphoserine/phosphohydroxythreonine transaminase [bacterium]